MHCAAAAEAVRGGRLSAMVKGLIHLRGRRLTLIWVECMRGRWMEWNHRV